MRRHGDRLGHLFLRDVGLVFGLVSDRRVNRFFGRRRQGFRRYRLFSRRSRWRLHRHALGLGYHLGIELGDAGHGLPILYLLDHINEGIVHLVEQIQHTGLHGNTAVFYFS